jgi:O-succinylbenzoate synthase
MQAHYQFRLYNRRLTTGFATRSGLYSSRLGAIVRLETPTGEVGYGEIAPLPWFSTETFDAVLQFCSHAPDWITTDDIAAIPDRLPATQFGFESAWQQLQSSLSQSADYSQLKESGLLPLGASALSSWQALWQQGYETFKWKIGNLALEQELKILQELCQVLPSTAKLRLDANGKLDEPTTRKFLTACEDQSQIEFIEQPLPPDRFPTLLQLTADYQTPIALDESVATLAHLRQCHDQGWLGIVVIKAAIVGFPSQLRAFCQNHDLDLVFSSVFETAIGRAASLQLAQDLGNPERAIGFGVQDWLGDRYLDDGDFDRIWQLLR